MSRTIAQVQHDLRELMRDPQPFEFAPPSPRAAVFPDPRLVRHSSVLILFGALDQTPAHAFDGDGVSSPVPAELDVLLTRRADHLRHHPGQIAFPGGGVEPGDVDAAATALREAAEEAAVDPLGVDVLGTLPPLPVPVSNNLVTPVIGWWRRPNETAADHSESVAVFRTPVAEMLDPSARGTSVLHRGGFTHRGAAFSLAPRLGGHIVWGFTGMLLAAIYDELGWSVPWDSSREFEVRP